MKILITIFMIAFASQLWSQDRLTQGEIQAASVQSTSGTYSLKGNISYYSAQTAMSDDRKFVSGMVYQLGKEMGDPEPLFSNVIFQSALYPNPTKGRVFVDTRWGKPQKAELLSIDGRLIDQLDLASSSIDLSNMNSGIYMLRIHDGSSWTFHRIVKE
ncbi:MAG: T9SS type A sorting domain-containing protein [Cyclobacteriaceae bacterium]